MSHSEWDEDAFRRSIPPARENAELAAKICSSLTSNAEGFDHKRYAELVFYMSKLDYDIKVLLLQFLTDPENRSLWERYLALGLSRVYVQAERYAPDSAVLRPEIQGFLGALHGNQAA